MASQVNAQYFVAQCKALAFNYHNAEPVLMSSAKPQAEQVEPNYIYFEMQSGYFLKDNL
jgi:hypothetical protein